MQYIQASIRPYTTYSFPLGIYSLQDVKRLDSKLITIAKKAYGLGNATPNNLILEKKDNMGLGLDSLLIDYAQLNGAYLTRALNDDGPLGWSTKGLLKLQHTRMAGMPVLSKDKPNPLLQNAAKDFHLLKKISLLKEADITLATPIHDEECKPYLELEGNTLVDLMCNAGYDPLCLGIKSEIPPKVYMPLFDLGITNVTQVLCSRKQALTSI